MEEENYKIINVDKPQVGFATPSLTFPAIVYRSGNRLWYALTVPYSVLRSGLIKTSSVRKKGQEIIYSEIRNRFLDKKHKNEIKSYIEEEHNFTIPPITLVTTEKLPFEPFIFGSNKKIISNEEFEARLKAAGSLAGQIQLPLEYQFDCLDGNHRAVAIKELVDESSSAVTDSDILLNIVYEKDICKIRQDFVDVNKNAKPTTPSINTLFNTREAIPNIVSRVIDQVDYMENIVDFVSTSISKNSNKIYTLNNIKNVVVELVGYDSQTGKMAEEKANYRLKSDDNIKREVFENTKTFFIALSKNYYICRAVTEEKKVTEIRQKTVITAGVGLTLCASLAAYVFKNFNVDEKQQELLRVMQYDWSRQNKVFYKSGLVGEDGAIANSHSIVAKTKEALFQIFGYHDKSDCNS